MSALRALVYPKHGPPSEVLRALTFKALAPPSATQVRVKVLLSPINPADINVIEGVYPDRPTPRNDLVPASESTQQSGILVAGSEAVAVVEHVGKDVNNLNLKEGDRVILDKSQLGAWASHMNVEAQNIMKVRDGVGDAGAATMRINPPTALGMLQSFTKLTKGDWIIQNGANSAVGQAVIQIAAAKGIQTINLIRDRPKVDELRIKLFALGATHVLTYDELADKAMKAEVKAWTMGKGVRLGLNCVGGKDTATMAGYLGHDAHLVSYGAMSKSPIPLSTSLFIFKNLTCHGYWQSKWYRDHSKEEREVLLNEVMDLLRSKQLREPEHEILPLKGSDGEVTLQVQQAFKTLGGGSHGKKILLQWADEV